MFSLASLLAIFIACSGLFGLSSQAIARRTREIGIRKVLGASLSRIMKLIQKEFLILVSVANIIAWPAVYFAIGTWLENFAYRIEISVTPFVLAGTTALLIACITISLKSGRAATANPVDSLRCE
jgi:putative ABC transport system permease protein